jgi:hypothetical protein
LLPKGVKPGRPPVWSRRQLIVHDLFRRWQRDGTWARIVSRLQAEADAKGPITWEVNVDSTVCRAHQHVADAVKKGDLQKEPPGGVAVAGDRGHRRCGRSRRG